MPQIDSMFNDKHKAFILVGDEHLVIDERVISRLKLKGYQITKVSLN
ncbi:hypothetical protein AADZ91_07450 [Colwelliaceae bacterium 6441]